MRESKQHKHILKWNDIQGMILLAVIKYYLSILIPISTLSLQTRRSIAMETSENKQRYLIFHGCRVN